MTRCFLTNEVWGQNYCRLFLDHILPSHLAPGNIPALVRRVPCEYRIYTTVEDAAWMEPHPNIARLRRHLPVTFIALDPTAAALSARAEEKYTHYARYLRQAVVDALAANAAILNLCPDAIFSDGTFERVAQLAEQGIRLICIPGVRVERDAFLADYHAACPPGPEGISPCAPRDLIPIALQHLHPLTQTLVWGTHPFNDTWPSHLYWRLSGNNGLIVRPFHLHAFYIDPVDKTFVPQSTLDDDYVQHACPDLRQAHFVQDSDEMVCFELSPPSHLSGQAEKGLPASIWKIGKWAARYCRPRHFEAFRHPLLIHAGPLQPSDHSTSAQSAAISWRILACARLWRLILGTRFKT